MQTQEADGLSSGIYYNPRDGQKAGRGQASVHSQGRVQNGTGRQAGSRSGAGRVVMQASSHLGQARVRTRNDEKKRDWEKTGATRKTLVDLSNKTNWHRQTENTGINTQGIRGKMGDTWRGVETSTRTGETDQGMTE